MPFCGKYDCDSPVFSRKYVFANTSSSKRSTARRTLHTHHFGCTLIQLDSVEDELESRKPQIHRRLRSNSVGQHMVWPVCHKHKARQGPPKAGSNPIETHGFSERQQVDLIDLRSTERAVTTRLCSANRYWGDHLQTRLVG
eukprot:COSAG06_NODE_4975_length_3815_cov_4.986276_4_plen_141_part_00